MSELTLLKQQLRASWRTLLIWVLVWTLLLFFFATIFNSFSKDAGTTAELFQKLPQGIFSAINIDPIGYLTKIEKFISGQFLFVYLLAGSIFSFAMGVSAIGKKVENRTIAGLLTKPLSRGRLYAVQYISSALFLAIAGTVIGSLSWLIMNLVIKYQANISGAYFGWLFVGTTLVFMTFAAIGQLVGSLLNGGHAVQLGAGLIVISWFVNSLSQVAHIPAVLQHLSVFYYFNVALLRDHFRLDKGLTCTLVGILLVFVVIGCVAFRRKNIYI